MSAYRRCSLAVFLLTVGLFCAVPGSAQDEKKSKLSADEQRLLELTNEARKEAKAPPLRADALLTEVARKHSANMAKRRELNHLLDGKKAKERLQDAGYAFVGYGENVYKGKVGSKSGSPETAMKSWMSSPGHRGNILEEKFEEIGIGIITNEKDEVYFTQVFAAPLKKP